MASTKPRKYLDNKGLTRALQTSIILSLGVLLVKARYWLAELNGENSLALPKSWESILLYLHIGLNLLICALFFAWFYRIHVNASRYCPNQKKMTESSKVILWAALPGINLLAPFFNTLEIFSASFRRRSFVELITAWWIAWLIYFVSSIASLIDMGTVYNSLATYGRMYSGALAHVALFTVVTIISIRQQYIARLQPRTTANVNHEPQEFKRLSEVMRSRKS